MYENRVFHAAPAAYSVSQPRDLSDVDLHVMVARGRIERSRMAAHLIGRAVDGVKGLFTGHGKAATA